MVSTAQLASLVRQAGEAGAKILLVGDPAQLDSIDAGGVLGWLDRQGKAARLSAIWRFTNPWERAASLALREGHLAAVSEYEQHDRICHGTYMEMVDRAYTGWHDDVLAGRVSVLIAPDNETVGMLNERAQADRIGLGDVDAERTVFLRDGLHAGRGDMVIARRNDRSIRDDHGAFIRNGTLMEVVSVDSHGSVRAILKNNGAMVVLTSMYVEASLELGYATTAHRSQGLTVDTAHTVVTPGRLTRELLYVSMTRGRHSNNAYVSENDPDEDEILDPSSRASWRSVLGDVLAAEGAERTAHEVRDFEHSHSDSLELLNREYDYLAQIAAGLDLGRSIEALSPGRANEMQGSPAWGAAVAAWRKANNHNRPGAQRVLSEALESDATAEDPAAVTHSRLRQFSSLIPRAAIDPMSERLVNVREDLTFMLQQVRRRISARTEKISRIALTDDPEWKTALIEELGRATEGYELATLIREVAVYRDRWGISDSSIPLGIAPADWEWQQHTQWQQLLDSAVSAHHGLALSSTATSSLWIPTQQSLTSSGWQL